MIGNRPAELRTAAVQIDRVAANMRHVTDEDISRCRGFASELYNRAAKIEREGKSQ